MNQRFHAAVTGGFSLSLSKVQCGLLADLYCFAAGKDAPSWIVRGRERQASILIEKGMVRQKSETCGYLDEKGALYYENTGDTVIEFTQAGLLMIGMLKEVGVLDPATLMRIKECEA